MSGARAWFAAVAALLTVAVFFCGWDFSLAAAPPAPGAPADGSAAPAAAAAMAAAPAPPSPTVKITFITVPSKPAMVFWGKKRLGVIAPHQPLVVQRPRDSGPLDVIVRSQGYLPVQ